MIGNRIRHVLVTDDARLIGVVSERDLFSLQRLGLGELTTEIRLAERSRHPGKTSPPKSANLPDCWWNKGSPPSSSPCTSRC